MESGRELRWAEGRRLDTESEATAQLAAQQEEGVSFGQICSRSLWREKRGGEWVDWAGEHAGCMHEELSACCIWLPGARSPPGRMRSPT